MKAELTEDYMVEQQIISLLDENEYSYIHGSELCPENEERPSYRDVILKKRFISAVKRLNPWLSESLTEQVYKSVSEIEHPDFLIKGKDFYEMLVNLVEKCIHNSSCNKRNYENG